MKKVTGFFAMLIGFFCYSQITVATISSDGTIRLTDEFQKVKTHFSSTLKAQNNAAILIDYQIKSDRSDSGKEYYYVLGRNEDNTVKVAHRLQLMQSSFIYDFNDSGGTTTCSGCPSGCNPKLGSDGYYYCTPCTDNSTNCSKSTTVGTNYP
ncbi:hypothetical protein [Chryseobacterium sp.]|uniref:hypothetical protein n=1 Tax=Chryseobacterium sp. TaxID=1871047 RepID=UPI0011CB1C7D|nr:hypothetical protein [Chryseobacterium sp.]TXF76258.1 hypothetical protein FUA25_10260 [Chryseobacterium sp.]